jgi:hypothetical protein
LWLLTLCIHQTGTGELYFHQFHPCFYK